MAKAADDHDLPFSFLVLIFLIFIKQATLRGIGLLRPHAAYLAIDLGKPGPVRVPGSLLEGVRIAQCHAQRNWIRQADSLDDLRYHWNNLILPPFQNARQSYPYESIVYECRGRP